MSSRWVGDRDTALVQSTVNTLGYCARRRDDIELWIVGRLLVDRFGRALFEVELAVVVPDGFIEGFRPVRDDGSSSYLATFAPADAFGTLVYAEARRRGAHRARQLVVLGDGAPWI